MGKRIKRHYNQLKCGVLMETIKSVIYNSCAFERYKSDDIKDVPKYL